MACPKCRSRMRFARELQTGESPEDCRRSCWVRGRSRYNHASLLHEINTNSDARSQLANHLYYYCSTVTTGTHTFATSSTLRKRLLAIFEAERDTYPLRGPRYSPANYHSHERSTAGLCACFGGPCGHAIQCRSCAEGSSPRIP